MTAPLSQLAHMAQADHLTKAEAAEHVGVSGRTLLRLTGKEIAHFTETARLRPDHVRGRG